MIRLAGYVEMFVSVPVTVHCKFGQPSHGNNRSQRWTTNMHRRTAPPPVRKLLRSKFVGQPANPCDVLVNGTRLKKRLHSLYTKGNPTQVITPLNKLITACLRVLFTRHTHGHGHRGTEVSPHENKSSTCAEFQNETLQQERLGMGPLSQGISDPQGVEELSDSCTWTEELPHE